MRHLVLKVIISALSLYLTTALLPQFSLPQAPKEFILIAIVFMLSQLIIKPIIKMLLLPLTVLTFGLVGAFADVIVLYLLDLVLPKVAVGTISLQIGTTHLIIQGLLAYILIAFTLQVMHALVKWALKA